MDELRIVVEHAGPVGALLRRPAAADAMLVMGHGAGAGMRHVFLERMAELLAERSIATLRYQFPYMERGSRRIDPRPLLLATVAAAVEAARTAAPELPLFAGGKSMGGRMTSLAAADGMLTGVRGLVFFGFPLHPVGRPGAERGQHLERVVAPMLFLQGSRDDLADLDLLGPVLARLGARATLQVFEGADHSFRVPRRSGRTDAEVLAQLADAVRGWLQLQR
jgi:hypothetical protein